MKDSMDKNSIALLSSKGEYTTFSFAGKTITFLTSKNLEHYTSVKEWDNGYIVVMVKDFAKPEYEDYIDLLPILENLYMDPAEFLKPIKGVEIQYV